MEFNYYNTFIKVAADCPVEYGIVPPAKKEGLTKPGIEYELLADSPYRYTQEELQFEVHLRHAGITPGDPEGRGPAAWQAFRDKPKPCMRASMLPKKYGWGLHFNEEGRVALVPLESEEYRKYAEGDDKSLRLLPAMRNKRA